MKSLGLGLDKVLFRSLMLSPCRPSINRIDNILYHGYTDAATIYCIILQLRSEEILEIAQPAISAILAACRDCWQNAAISQRGHEFVRLSKN